MLALWLWVANQAVEFPVDPEKINGKVVQTWYAFKPQVSFVQRWRLLGQSYSRSGNITLVEMNRVTFERKVPRNDSRRGLFARLTGGFSRRGLDSQLALITGSMNQMQSGVNFVDFKGKMTKVQLDRMEVKVDALPTRDEYLELKATVDALKATVDALPTSAQFKALKATVDDLPTSAEYLELKATVDALPTSAQFKALKATVDALPTSAQFKALKATVDDLPTSAEFKALKAQVKGEHQALRAQVADLPTRRELFALVIALVIVFGLFFWGIQKRWSDETKLRARFMPPFVNDRCSSPASRSCNRRQPPYPGSAPADLWQTSRTHAW